MEFLLQLSSVQNPRLVYNTFMNIKSQLHQTAIEKQSLELMKPMLDVFSGIDGGAAFIKLQHSFLPQMLSKAGDPQVDEFLKMISQFNRLCKMLLNEKI